MRFHSLAGDPNNCLNRVSASVRALDQAVLLEDEEEEEEEVMKEKSDLFGTWSPVSHNNRRPHSATFSYSTSLMQLSSARQGALPM